MILPNISIISPPKSGSTALARFIGAQLQRRTGCNIMAAHEPSTGFSKSAGDPEFNGRIWRVVQNSSIIKDMANDIPQIGETPHVNANLVAFILPSPMQLLCSFAKEHFTESPEREPISPDRQAGLLQECNDFLVNSVAREYAAIRAHKEELDRRGVPNLVLKRSDIVRTPEQIANTVFNFIGIGNNNDDLSLLPTKSVFEHLEPEAPGYVMTYDDRWVSGTRQEHTHFEPNRGYADPSDQETKQKLRAIFSRHFDPLSSNLDNIIQNSINIMKQMESA